MLAVHEVNSSKAYGVSVRCFTVKFKRGLGIQKGTVYHEEILVEQRWSLL